MVDIIQTLMSTQPVPIIATRIPHSHRLYAAERLVAIPEKEDAARRLVASAQSHGIDLNLMWGVLTPKESKAPNRVRQVALAVLGPGKTAMLFLSTPTCPPGASDDLGSHQAQITDITSSVRSALDGLKALAPDRVSLAQTLVEPEHTWAHQACIEGGMTFVGNLTYLRKPYSPPKRSTKPIPAPTWPAGIEVRKIRSIDPDSTNSDRQVLIEALEASYLETLDCPELCGIRDMQDVVDSHQATGEFSPDRWHLIFKDNEPVGCCLLSFMPASQSVELVYIGIAPPARGLGLGKSVLKHAINQLGAINCKEITCAVDDRNLPAIKIYDSLGFKPFDARLGFVASITP